MMETETRAVANANFQIVIRTNMGAVPTMEVTIIFRDNFLLLGARIQVVLTTMVLEVTEISSKTRNLVRVHQMIMQILDNTRHKHVLMMSMLV